MNYTNLYHSIISNRQLNPVDGYTERHHIKPKSLGGDNSPSNLVSLTAREHFICHWLLTKIYDKGPSHFKMVKAFSMMARMRSGNQQRHITTSRTYNAAKRMHAAVRSIEMTENNHQSGTMWVHDPITLINKKINKCDEIPNGYIIGRKLKRKLCDCGNEIVGGTDKKRLCADCKSKPDTGGRDIDQIQIDWDNGMTLSQIAHKHNFNSLPAVKVFMNRVLPDHKRRK